MIFLTVGTTRFAFDRLLKAVDEALLSLKSSEKLIIQKGPGQYQFRYSNTEIFDEMSFKKMISLLKQARVVVTHGGPATIFLALKHSKNKPLIVPRLPEFKEHVNNHQEIFAKFLSQKKMIEAILLPENLEEQIGDYLKKPAFPLREAKKNDTYEKLVRNLINYTESLQ